MNGKILTCLVYDITVQTADKSLIKIVENLIESCLIEIFVPKDALLLINKSMVIESFCFLFFFQENLSCSIL